MRILTMTAIGLFTLVEASTVYAAQPNLFFQCGAESAEARFEFEVSEAFPAGYSLTTRIESKDGRRIVAWHESVGDSAIYKSENTLAMNVDILSVQGAMFARRDLEGQWVGTVQVRALRGPAPSDLPDTTPIRDGLPIRCQVASANYEILSCHSAANEERKLQILRRPVTEERFIFTLDGQNYEADGSYSQQALDIGYAVLGGASTVLSGRPVNRQLWSLNLTTYDDSGNVSANDLFLCRLPIE